MSAFRGQSLSCLHLGDTVVAIPVHVTFPAANRLGRTEPFAIAHLKLMKDDDTAIQDGTHDVYVYKVRRGPKGKESVSTLPENWLLCG